MSILKFFSKVTTPLSTPRANSTIHVSLPNLNIPIFSGNYADWNAFYDLFKALIDKNDQLESIQKFAYLKFLLKGQALNIVKDLPLTSENYCVAFELLQKQYGKRIVIINTHIQSIIEIPNLIKSHAHRLREFITCIKQNINSLKALKIDVEQWDLILVYMLTKKLDNDTQHAYKLQEDSESLPTVESLLNFLEKRCFALENVQSSNSNNKMFQTPSGSSERKVMCFSKNLKTKPLQKCIFCQDEQHKIYLCIKF